MPSNAEKRQKQAPALWENRLKSVKCEAELMQKDAPICLSSSADRGVLICLSEVNEFFFGFLCGFSGFFHQDYGGAAVDFAVGGFDLGV